MEVVLSLRGMLAGSMRGALRVIKVKGIGPGFIPLKHFHFLRLYFLGFLIRETEQLLLVTKEKRLMGMLFGSRSSRLIFISMKFSWINFTFFSGKVSAIHIALYDLGPGFIPVNQNNFLSLVLSRFIRCCIQAMFLVKCPPFFVC
ncbi:Uncharacterized protein TCM_006387 isoform 1 [Theobroma cacao]|uniref:Uncharacterized protein isoform 1 n=1 Tax=Theobroma cacao TaxID=3641 RepID=A0A061E4Y5_THECC|nr:Uncharacterized protein TCM_006387 isoform 1 [Theobroma cacao]